MEKEIEISESRLRYEHYAHSVGMVMLHLQWCTKYRYKMFWWRSNIKLIEACIRRSASRNGIKIIELNVQPEHIHCVVMVKFSLSTSKVLQLLKGGSSRLFFEHQKKLDFDIQEVICGVVGNLLAQLALLILVLFRIMFELKMSITRKLHTLVWRGCHI